LIFLSLDNEGSLCYIGLSGNGQDLNGFIDSLNGYLQSHNSLPVNINVTNNPNNNGRRIPNVNE
jgi:hypothetical protein